MNSPLLPTLYILLVEDEPTMIQSWQRVIARQNADKAAIGFSIDLSVANSISSAHSILESRRFDAVIVDLRLKQDDNASEINADGNEVVKLIISTQPIGVVIYTGQPQDAEDFTKSFVSVMNKGAGHTPVLNWISQNKEVFLGIRAAEAAFRRETAKIFFSQIWQRWKYWTEGAKGSDTNISTSVARHVMAHVHDVLLSADGDNTHPEEAYFVPPLKLRLDTGDIVLLEDEKWIVVSPRCDLANPQKVDTILLAKCIDFSEQWTKIKDKRSDQHKMTQHQQSPKQHFLFPLMDNVGTSHGPWMVQFHNIRTMPTSEAISTLPELRFASLSPLFVPSLVERFGSYFSRIGTPGFSG